MPFHFTDLVGTYRLIVSPELLTFIDQTFVAPAREADQPTIRAEALAEAEAARLEIHADGTVISRAGPIEFYRIKLDIPAGAIVEIVFTKPPHQLVTLRMPAADSVVAMQAGKPEAHFQRVT